MTRTRQRHTGHTTAVSTTAHRATTPLLLLSRLHSVSRTVSVVGREESAITISASFSQDCTQHGRSRKVAGHTSQRDTDSRHRDTHGDSTQTYGTTNTQQPAPSSSTPIVWPCHHSIAVLDCMRITSGECESILCSSSCRRSRGHSGHKKPFARATTTIPTHGECAQFVARQPSVKRKSDEKPGSQQMRCPVQWHAGRLGPWGQARILCRRLAGSLPPLPQAPYTSPQRMPPPQCDRIVSRCDATLT